MNETASPFPTRRSLRLAGYDYAQSGAYFVTIVVHQQKRLFGAVEEEAVRLSPAGEMVTGVWRDIPEIYAGVEIDTVIVMPDHVHAIVVLDGVTKRAATESRPYTLADIVSGFKSYSTRHYIRGVKDQKWPRFAGTQWQRSYYDHVIRNEADLNRIRAYIDQNPLRWTLHRDKS